MTLNRLRVSLSASARSLSRRDAVAELARARRLDRGVGREARRRPGDLVDEPGRVADAADPATQCLRARGEIAHARSDHVHGVAGRTNGSRARVDVPPGATGEL